MPIEEISDYPEKMTEFELHWASVNAALGGSPATDFKLQGGYTVAQFSNDKAAIIAILDDLIGLENQVTYARSDRDALRTPRAGRSARPGIWSRAPSFTSCSNSWSAPTRNFRTSATSIPPASPASSRRCPPTKPSTSASSPSTPLAKANPARTPRS